MIEFEWKGFSPAGGEFITKADEGHVLAAFMTGEEAWAGAMDNRQPRHAECYRTTPLVGFIDEINVKRPFRRRGVGSALLSATLEKFKELGVPAVYLRAQPERPEWLVDLLRFYWRYGFEVEKDCVDLGDTTLTLKADLS